MTTTGALLWQRLREAGLVSAERPPDDTTVPWYIHVLVSAGIWLATVLVTAFAAITILDHKEYAGLFVYVAVTATAAVGALRFAPGNLYLEQVATVASLSAQCLIVAAASFWRDADGLWYAALVVAIIQYALAPPVVHRFLCSLVAALAIGMILEKADVGAKHYMTATFAVGAVLIWCLAVQGRWWDLVPAAWGWTLVALALELFAFDHSHHLRRPMEDAHFMGHLVVAGMLPVVTLVSLGQYARRGSVLPIIAGVAALGFAALAWPASGLLLGLCLAVIGFHAGRPLLVALSLIASGISLAQFYIGMELPLLQKSLLLVGNGLLLLALRWIARGVSEKFA
ncbi:DUF4401 domain-containing protein [Tahibacter amnicola]|uniref:DUF4401 domain-containing protein n=1 Tax=Tahibacter amnicola TaxID=2976241 RepID=A0ABY6BQR3_9GAMM|nr:DUF4401 domain-containing protein [Tahibacter amnicola]UXI70107.1 DUF4401 domain-containing protein [Tahibacter amnicola]